MGVGCGNANVNQNSDNKYNNGDNNRNNINNYDNNKTYKIVFVRHGESVWNKLNKFTGWTDVDLSEVGK